MLAALGVSSASVSSTMSMPKAATTAYTKSAACSVASWVSTSTVIRVTGAAFLPHARFRCVAVMHQASTRLVGSLEPAAGIVDNASKTLRVGDDTLAGQLRPIGCTSTWQGME